ncbi:hypothetical protein D3C76_625280 [compost metagenome]
MAAVFYRDGRKVCRTGAAFVDKARGAHGIHRRQDHAGGGVQVGHAVIALHGDGATAQRRQLLDAEHQHPFVLPGLQGMAGQVHGGGTTGAGVFDVVDGNALEAQVAQNDLAENHPAQHIGAINRLDIGQCQAGVGHGVEDCALCKFRRPHTGMAAEGCHGCAHYVHLAHERASRDSKT